MRVGGPMMARMSASEGSGWPSATNASCMQRVIVSCEFARTPSRSKRNATRSSLWVALRRVVGGGVRPRVAGHALVGAARAAEARVLAHVGVVDPEVRIDALELVGGEDVAARLGRALDGIRAERDRDPALLDLHVGRRQRDEDAVDGDDGRQVVRGVRVDLLDLADLL